jgi:putative ABC transport system substrate-binding protein
MRRRDLTWLLGGAAIGWHLAARAQQLAMPVIGFLGSSSLDRYTKRVTAFWKGLKEAGYFDGQNVAIQYRWAYGQYDRLPGLAADLVRRQVAVIVAGDGPAAPAAKSATTTIPIIFNVGYDPVISGLVPSLNRPGGNVTGVTVLGVEVAPKLLQVLHEWVPTATIIAALVNPTNPNAETLSRDLQAAARTLGLQLHILHASTERDFDRVYATLAELRAGGLVIGTDTFFTARSEQLASLAISHAVPTIYPHREFPAAGGLMSYGASLNDAYLLVGVYTGKVLKGDKPGDLPVQQPTRFELVINIKTAKALGLEVPPLLLARADEVIE